MEFYMTSPSDKAQAAIAELVADGRTKKVSGPTGTAFIVPEAVYKQMLTDSLSWGHVLRTYPDRAQDLGHIAFQNIS